MPCAPKDCLVPSRVEPEKNRGQRRQTRADLADRLPSPADLQDASDEAHDTQQAEEVRVVDEPYERPWRLTISERHVPEDDRGAEQTERPEDRADHEVRAKRQRPHHAGVSSMQ